MPILPIAFAGGDYSMQSVGNLLDRNASCRAGDGTAMQHKQRKFPVE